jgi:predicted permease
VTYSATAGGNSLVSTRGTAFLAVFSVVTLLTLIIVCANVANLLIGRAVVRQRELALRQSLGASRLRIVRMLLAEGFVISALAWAASCVFAWWTARALAGFVAPSASGGLPRFVTFTPDWTVLGYALLLALVATVVFTVAPAMRAWRQSLLPSLKSGEQGVVGGRSRLSSGLVILQLAFSVLLLTSAGLAYRSVFLLGTQDLGFETRNLLLVTVNTAGSAADRAADGPLIDRIRERLWAVPGVRSVSYARSPARERWSSVVVLTSAAGAPLFAEQNYVGPAYLPVHGLDRIAGRELDREEGRTIPSAMINRGLADALWPRQSPLGRRLLIGSEHLEVEVVGITPDAYFGGFRHTNPRHVLLSSQHDPTEPGELTFYMRHEGTLDAIAPLVRRALRAVDAHVPVVSLRSMDAQLESIIWPVRLLTTLLALFAGGSLLIATIGQYAVVAFDMRRRVREFGVRIALGASSGQVLTSVIRDGLRLTALGLAVGFVLSLGAGRAMGGLLYGVTPTDALTYAGVFALLLAASLLACALPARRAARIDPVRALRFE